MKWFFRKLWNQKFQARCKAKKFIWIFLTSTAVDTFVKNFKLSHDRPNKCSHNVLNIDSILEQKAQSHCFHFCQIGVA